MGDLMSCSAPVRPQMSEERTARAARYSDLFGAGHEHASDCAYCPICATISVVRETRPEILEHLAAAAKELVIAAGILVDEAGEILERASADVSKRPSGEADNVRHIDIG